MLLEWQRPQGTTEQAGCGLTFALEDAWGEHQGIGFTPRQREIE